MNDIALLNKVIERKSKEYSSDLDEGEIFEFFVVDTILRNYGLSYDELNDGIVDGSKDGGIDAVYLFVNRSLVTDDFDFSAYKGSIEIECLIFQSKCKTQFEEAVVNSLNASLPLFFDTSLPPGKLKASLNSAVVAKAMLLRECLEQFSLHFPEVRIKIFYACRGTAPSSEISEKAKVLKKNIEGKLSVATTKFDFFGAQQLYEQERLHTTVTLSLPIFGSPLNVDNAFVALVNLKDYYSFISTDDQLSERLFEFNIRDYEGVVSVNKEIKQSLKNKSGEVDFWWLNNGITIIAERAKNQNNALVVTNPLIVNGLQTSNEVFSAKPEDDERKILVRVIDTENEKIRDQIIKATNSQTKIRESSLRATEEIQIRIEDFLIDESIYYDRRKNYYKNRGKPAKQIIGIDRMAQCVFSVLVQRPDVARARPGTIIRENDLYKKIFSIGHPLGLYVSCFRLHLLVSQHLQSVRKVVDPIYRNNLRFHLMMVLSWVLCGKKDISAMELADIDVSTATSEKIEDTFKWLQGQFNDAGAEDRVAKDKSFVGQIKNKWKKIV